MSTSTDIQVTLYVRKNCHVSASVVCGAPAWENTLKNIMQKKLQIVSNNNNKITYTQLNLLVEISGSPYVSPCVFNEYNYVSLGNGPAYELTSSRGRNDSGHDGPTQSILLIIYILVPLKLHPSSLQFKEQKPNTYSFACYTVMIS